MSDVQRVGPVAAGDGTPTPFRADITSAQVVADAHGRYAEAARRGTLFHLNSGAVTCAATHVTKSALGTITLINGFYNPAGSGYNIEVLRTAYGTVSGTPGGPMFYNFYSGVPAVAAAETGVIYSGLLSAIIKGPTVARALVSVAVVTVPALTAAMIELGLVGGPAAVAAGAGLYGGLDEVAGAIVVPPGTIFGLATGATGTSHIVHSTLSFEQVLIK